MPCYYAVKRRHKVNGSEEITTSLKQQRREANTLHVKLQTLGVGEVGKKVEIVSLQEKNRGNS